MSHHVQKLFEPLQTFLMNDQPFTCPHCGSRCEEIGNFYHTNAKVVVEKCLNNECGFICFEEENEYYLKLWGLI
jgi:hypothetical protein